MRRAGSKMSKPWRCASGLQASGGISNLRWGRVHAPVKGEVAGASILSDLVSCRFWGIWGRGSGRIGEYRVACQWPGWLGWSVLAVFFGTSLLRYWSQCPSHLWESLESVLGACLAYFSVSWEHSVAGNCWRGGDERTVHPWNARRWPRVDIVV